MYSKAMANDLKEKNIRVFTINPGWMKTKMGGEKAELLPSESAKGIIDIVRNFSLDESGGFYDYSGENHDW